MPIRLTFFDVVLFAAMVLGLVIGIHQSIYYGVMASYWLFMISLAAFLWLNSRLRSRQEDPALKLPGSQPEPGKKTKGKGTDKRKPSVK
jgi:hypothetical protein